MLYGGVAASMYMMGRMTLVSPTSSMISGILAKNSPRATRLGGERTSEQKMKATSESGHHTSISSHPQCTNNQQAYNASRSLLCSVTSNTLHASVKHC